MIKEDVEKQKNVQQKCLQSTGIGMKTTKNLHLLAF